MGLCSCALIAASDKIYQCRVLRDVIPPTPPGPEGSNGNGLMRVQWVTRYIFVFSSFLMH